MPDYDVIVIGAGVGGLTAASLCEKMGMKTLVLEQSDRVGGCCSTYEADGFHFDVGASVVEVPQAFHELFRRLGKDIDEYIPLMQLDPIYDYCDNTRDVRFAYPTSIEETAEVIARFAPEDARTFLEFAREFTPRILGLIDNFFYHPCQGVMDIVRLVRKYPAMLKELPLFLTTQQKEVRKYASNDDVLASMAFQSFYAGLPPDLCAGIYAIVSLAEHEGIFYPPGGMIQIPKGIQKAFEELGGETMLGRRVVRIMVKNRTAVGVELWDGTQITSGRVIGAVNARTVYMDMIGREHLPWHVWRGIDSMRLSMPCPMVYLGIDYEHADPDRPRYHERLLEQQLRQGEDIRGGWGPRDNGARLLGLGGRPLPGP